MSAYQCPGCGMDAPLSVECQRCEVESLEHTAWPSDDLRASLKRLEATRAALRSSLEQNAAALAELLTAREELEAERRKVAELQRAVVGAHRRRQEESRRRLRHRDELKRLRAVVAAFGISDELPPNRWDCPTCGPDATATFEECCANCGAACMVIQDGVWRHARNRESAAETPADVTSGKREVPELGSGVKLVKEMRRANSVLIIGAAGRVVSVSPSGEVWAEFHIGSSRVCIPIGPDDVEILTAEGAA